MVKEIAIMHIENEKSQAKEALKAGNEGKARVCARRAAGIAITFWLQSHPELKWGESSINLLNNLKEDNSVPVEIKQAAIRLTTSVKDQSSLPFTQDPFRDSDVIVKYFLNNN